MLRLFRRNSHKSGSDVSRRGCRRARLQVESLESRTLLSIFTPAQIENAYGFNQISFDVNGKTVTGNGSGETIAIVDAYDDPTIQSDLHAFDQEFGISEPANFFTKTSPTGVLPAADPNWAVEESLDVEWAHAMAPGAKILLVEAQSDSLSNLLSAVKFAADQPGVAVVSMSWGGDEFAGETALDSYFTTPAGHSGVTFVAASGDNGAWDGPDWPASSPSVLAVGGTTLHLTSTGAYGYETGWSDSTGGFSAVESEPSYQTTALGNTGARTTPDLSFDANPYTGYYLYDSFETGGTWFEVGGTSAGAPLASAMVAIADQGRALAGKASLNGATQTLPAIYALASSAYGTYFHDVTSGFNGYYAGPGYDLVTGLGSPRVNALVSGLVSVSGTGSNLFAKAAVSTPTSTSSSSATTGPTGASHQGSSPSAEGNSEGTGLPTGGNSGQQAPGGSAGSTPTASSPVFFLLAVHSTQAGPGILTASSAVVVSPPAVAAAEAQNVPVAAAPPRVVDTQESGGGDAGLLPADLDQTDETDTVAPDPDLSPAAPRMAPVQPTEDGTEDATEDETASWRRANDYYFASRAGHETVRSDGPAQTAQALANPAAVLFALGLVVASARAGNSSESGRDAEFRVRSKNR
jgi:hypothetical protein